MTTLIKGDCLSVLKTLPDNFFDSLVTDPPAGISFMNKDWDNDKGGSDHWIAWLSQVMVEVLRTLKPGAHGLVWSLPRTSHWTATALERSGFEVRDCVTHLFGTGFPKSLDISKAIDKAAGAERTVIVGEKPYKTNGNVTSGNFGVTAENDPEKRFIEPILAPATAAAEWSGWGTALKPAAEFWWLIRKPLSENTVAANVLKWGCGGINIGECRIATSGADAERHAKEWDRESRSDMRGGSLIGAKHGKLVNTYSAPSGRYPANLVLSHHEGCEQPDGLCHPDCAVKILDEQSGTSKSRPDFRNEANEAADKSASMGLGYRRKPSILNDSGGASRFFYIAKASKSDRGNGNTHPTVKSTDLMEYLCTLITPPNGTIIDPFMGSGSTGVAALRAGFDFYGVERENEYFTLASKRLAEV